MCQKAWDEDRDVLCSLMVIGPEDVPVSGPDCTVTGSVDGVEQRNSRTKSILGRAPWMQWPLLL